VKGLLIVVLLSRERTGKIVNLGQWANAVQNYD